MQGGGGSNDLNINNIDNGVGIVLIDISVMRSILV